MKNKGSIIIAAFGGLGKTTCARKYPDLAVDVEAVGYKYIYRSPQAKRWLAAGQHERLKGRTHDRVINDQFPENYVNDVRAHLGNYRYILVVLSHEILAEFERLGLEYYIVYPAPDTASVILNRLKSRGNSDDFIRNIGSILSTARDKRSWESSYHPIEFCELAGDAFLEDFIITKFGNLAFSPNHSSSNS